MRSGSWHCWSEALGGRATVEQEWESAPEPGKRLRGIALTVLTKATPGYAGGEKELIARGGVDKKKSPS